MGKKTEAIKALIGRATARPAPPRPEFSFVVGEGAHMLCHADWDALTAGHSLFLSRRYLGALAATAPQRLAPRAALVYRNGRPVAAVSAQIIEFEPGHLVRKDVSAPAPERKRDRLARAVVTHAFDALPTRALMCGNLYSWGLHGAAIAPDEDPRRIWPAVAEALDRIRKFDGLAEQSAMLLIKDIADERAAELAVLEAQGYRSMEMEPDMVLTFGDGWKTHDDYLNSLNSKYRKSVKGIFKEVEAAGLQVEILADLVPHAARIHDLYMQVWSKATVRGPAITADYLPRLAAALGPDFRMTVLRRGGQLAGFVTTLNDGENGVGYIVGVDYEENARAPVYLRLMHATLDESIRFGCRRLTLGPTALEPKARLGCRAVPGRAMARHQHPLLNAVLGELLRFMPHEEPPDRNPFR